MIPKPVIEFAGRKFQTCSKCKEILEQDQFALSKQRKSGRYSSCNKCRSLAWQRYKETPKFLDKQRKTREASLRYSRTLREDVLAHYSQGKLVCACCSESEYQFLVLDHINGGGNKHRRSGTIGKGLISVYSWAKKNGYPEGFQVLCHNCNMARACYGECPHIKKMVANAA